MIRRRIDTLALAFAVAFLLAALLLAWAWVDTGSAAVPQRVLTKRATARIYAGEKRAWRHETRHGRAFAIRCSFSDARGRGAHRRGVPERCTFRVYRHADYTGLMATFVLRVTVVAREQQRVQADGSGAVTYSGGRSLRLVTEARR